MSIIFGFLNELGAPAAKSELLHLAVATERYATAVSSIYTNGRIGMGFQPYFSHQRSTMETRPAEGPYGHALSFDGRLDNHKELGGVLGIGSSDVSDSQIVLAAFVRWGRACFSYLLGDWALALWSEKDQTLYLARDHAGTRTLYFRHDDNKVYWSTHLDTFSHGGSELRLAEEYVACYLASHPIRGLTPFEGVRSVPPAHYLAIRNNTISQYSHWSSTVTNSVRYKSDAEYEAHFLSLFEQSIVRRTGEGAPIIAELSGGMDSTAIVCMSDYLRRAHDPSAEILDTVSFFDDSESSLNEKTYFSITEAYRGKVGIHFDTAFSQRSFKPHISTEGTYLLPGGDSSSMEQERRFYDGVWRRGYRSILSGIGGDEVLGGNPSPLPELAGQLLSGNILRLLQQAVAWSLIDRSPLLGTLYNTGRYVVDLYANSGSYEHSVPPWISGRLRKKGQGMGYSNPTRYFRLGMAPHCLENSRAWWSVMETLPHSFPQNLMRAEYRYPFLDKDLVTYLFSIPRDQVLRPGRRRSLMRRALRSIVPHEILERRRKAFQLRAPLRALRQAQPVIESIFADSLLAHSDFIDISRLRAALKGVAQGDWEWWQALLKTVDLELWLRTSNYRTHEHFRKPEDASLSFSSIAHGRS